MNTEDAYGFPPYAALTPHLRIGGIDLTDMLTAERRILESAMAGVHATLIPGAAVPLSLLGATAIIYLAGFSLDNLSLMALTIAVGFVVDDAIVVVENIFRHLEAGTTPLQSAIKGAREIGFTVLSISISLIAVFIPLLHGERSPDWNSQLTGSWHGLTARHTAADLWRSILEGVVFNLAHFVDIVQNTSGIKPSDIVLSGNGFLHPLAAPILAAVVDAAVWMPGQPGLASLRGSGICALRALGAPVPPLKAKSVAPLEDTKIPKRYEQYRNLRGCV